MDMGFIRNLLATVAATMLVVHPAGRAQQPPAAPLQTHQLANNVFWVDGGVSNSGIIVGETGVIIIDTKMTPENGKQLLEEVTKITGKPVTTIILTHRDVDHIGGLPAFPKDIEIIAHDVLPTVPGAAPAGRPGVPAPPPVQPTRVITSNKETLNIDGVKFELLHWAPAHTSGDTVVYLPEQKIVFAGDILALDFPRPLIHEDQHGSSAGWIETVKGMLALDADKYVPGHGSIQTKSTIEPRLKLAETERKKIVELVAKGKSLAIIESRVRDPGPGQANSGSNGPHFTPYSEVVYNELTAKSK